MDLFPQKFKTQTNKQINNYLIIIKQNKIETAIIITIIVMNSKIVRFPLWPDQPGQDVLPSVKEKKLNTAKNDSVDFKNIFGII